MMALGVVALIAGCKKDKEAPAVIEEVPAAAPPAAPETDTSATLSEEPALKQVGKEAKPGKGGKAGKGKNGKMAAEDTFHPSASADKAGFSDAGHFVVQVAIFKSKKQAANLVEKLANSGYPAYVAEVENPVPSLSGTYHRVRIGKFLKIADARAFGENTIKPMGYDFWVDNKKNDNVGGEGGGAPAASEAPAPKVSHKGKKKGAEPAAMPGTEAPAAASSEPAQPSEPAAPSGETWGTPKSDQPATAPAEPAAPSGETWGTPKSDQPAAAPSEPASAPASAAPAEPAAKPAAKTPAGKAPGDTGKVNLDEW